MDGSVDGDKPGSKAQYWLAEFDAADKWFEDWRRDGVRVVNRYLDERKGDDQGPYCLTKLNLFHANITTLLAMLYGKMPKIAVDRKFLDPNDDVARVAASIGERILAQDCYDPDDKYAETLKMALSDRLLPGLGGARVRYRMVEETRDTPAILGENGEELAPAISEPYKSAEWVDIVYDHWKDVIWSPCRVQSEMRWKAFRSYMNRKELVERFKNVGARVPLNSPGPSLDDDGARRAKDYEAYTAAAKQAEVWEIWNKGDKKVYWWVRGFDEMLDEIDDPCGFEDFFPDAKDMVANVTTTKYLPKPDYMIAQDLYEEIDTLETRISMLTAAAKVVGVYDKSNKGVERMLTEGVENQLIPVDNWAMLAERGGLQGVIDFLPLKDVVDAINILSAMQRDKIQQLYQVTGMSDIMRGQATTQGVTATEQKIKAQFGSVRINALQAEFAEFASTLLSKKLHLIQKLYDDARIVQLSNIDKTVDAPLVPAALKLFKDCENFKLRVVIQPEDMAQIDYDQQQNSRTMYLQGVAQFIGQAVPLIQMDPSSAPFLSQLMQWGLAGFKGSKDAEGIIDQWVAQQKQMLAKKASEPPQPSPEEKKAMIEADSKKQELQLKAGIDQQSAQNDFQLKQMEMAQEMQLEREEHQLKMREMQQKHELEMAKLQMQLQAQAQKSAMDIRTNEIKLQQDAQRTNMELTADAERNEMESKHEDKRFQREERQAVSQEKRDIAADKRAEKAAAQKAKATPKK